MPADEFQARLHAVELAARYITTAEPSLLLEALTRAESLGPIVDPSLFKASMAGVAQQRRLLEACLHVEVLVKDELAKAGLTVSSLTPEVGA